MDREQLDRFPLNGTFELTARCNLSCKMCLVRIDNKRMAELGGRERTAGEWIHMAQEVQEAGTLGLLLTGGEPMLRPDFIQIYKAIAQMGFILTLYTNATLVTEEIMEVLREFPPHSIGITAYGASSKTYEKVCGNANAYNRMLKGVDQLKRLPSNLSIRTTIIKDNLEDLDEISEWAHSLGPNIDFSISRIVTKPVRGGIADVEACRLSPEENVSLLEKAETQYMVKPFIGYLKDNPQITDFLKLSKEKKIERADRKEDHSKNDKSTLYGCDAGVNSYTITWDGKLIGCQLLGDCWTHPFHSGFQLAWDDLPKLVVIPTKPEQCNDCNITCSACPATRLAETGALGGYPGYLCNESKLASNMNKKLISEIKKYI